MPLPKVVFTHVPKSLEVNWIHGFLFNNKWGWGRYILKKHPALKHAKTIEGESAQVAFLKKYVTDFRERQQKVIETNKQRYQIAWQKVEQPYFLLLQKIMDTEWPRDERKIKAMLSINPICPRFLDSWNFTVFYKYRKMKDMLEIIMHESCHFLYFKKWLELYPKSDPETFEWPHIEWHLSELVAPIILNDEKVQKLLKQKAVFYEEHTKRKIRNSAAPKYFTTLYQQHMNQERGFETFLKEAYKKIKNYKKEFIYANSTLS